MTIVPMNAETSNQNSLVEVFNAVIGGVNQLAVNARDLHYFLAVRRDFSTWVKGRISEYKFAKDLDFITFTEKTVKQNKGSHPNGGKPKGGRPATQYHLTIDMAKELSMVENNEQGRKVRRYFINCEKSQTKPKPKLIGEQTTTTDRSPISKAISLLVAKSDKLDHQIAYTMLNQYMGVKTVGEIPKNRITEAVAYVHTMTMRAMPSIERVERDPLVELLDDKKCNEISNYFHDLHDEIKRLGGNQPITPVIESDDIIKQFATLKIQGSRMMLSVDHKSETVIRLIPRSANIIHDNNIAGVISNPCVVSKEKLPDIMNAVLKRASK